MGGETSDLKLARVIHEERERFLIDLDGDDVLATISGRLRHRTEFRSDLPTVGDYVEVTYNPLEGMARIQKLHPRRTRLVRKLAGEHASEQILASNIETAFLLNSLNRDLNLRRIERYLVMVRDGRITPVLVLTKSDLVPDLEAEELKQKVQRVAGNDLVLCTSIKEPESFNQLKAFFRPGETIALIGSSGVGKSTLTNLFLKQDVQTIQSIGEHAERGKHTTTSRSLFKTESGAFLMDTPGIREIQLWSGEEGFDDSFGDVLQLLGECRFSNCSHNGDIGCAIEKAIANGELEAGRFKSFLKIQKEQAYMEAKERARTSSHIKHIWKSRKKKYRRGK